MRTRPWHVRLAVLLVGVWAVWLLGFVVWALTVPELASGDAARAYAVDAAVMFVVVAVGLALAVWRPDWGAIGSGLLITLLAGGQGGGHGIDGLAHWGDVMLGDQSRTTSWVLLDSIAGVPYWVLLAAGALLVVGGVAHLRYPMNGYLRAGFLLVAVWAVWLTAFAGWSGNAKELTPENTYMYYAIFAWFVALPVVATALLVATAFPRWGAIVAGLGTIVGAGQASRSSVHALQTWGDRTIGQGPDYDFRPWALLDSIGLLPYWALLAAGLVITMSGIVEIRHQRHHTTPHAGATA